MKVRVGAWMPVCFMALLVFCVGGGAQEAPEFFSKSATFLSVEQAQVVKELFEQMHKILPEQELPVRCKMLEHLLTEKQEPTIKAVREALLEALVFLEEHPSSVEDVFLLESAIASALTLFGVPETRTKILVANGISLLPEGVLTAVAINANGSTSGAQAIQVTRNGSSLFVVDGTTGAVTAASTAALNGGITVNSGKFTVESVTGNVSTQGNITAQNMTSENIMAVGGTAALNGGINVNAGKFTVEPIAGNVVTQGNITAQNITSENIVASGGLAALNGGINVNAGKFIVEPVSGATTIAGAVQMSNLAGSGTRFVQADPSGNLSASGGSISPENIALITNHILVGNASNLAADVAMSGDTTITTTGAVTVTSVGGVSAAAVASGATAANNAVSTATANRIVLRDASGNFAAGTITASLTGAASLNVLKTGDTMTGTLTMTPSAGALAVTGSNTTSTVIAVTGGTSTGAGLALNMSAGTGKGLQITTAASTRAIEVNPIAPTFTVDGTTGNTTIAGSTTLSALSTGVVHANASGVLSSSTIVNADVSSSAAIDRSKLASGSANQVLINDGSGVMSSEATLAVSRGGTGASTLTSGQLLVGAGTSAVTFQPFTNANTASAVVQRDASGNFAAGTITASLTGAASLNVLKAGDTMTGNLTLAAQAAVRLQDAAGGEYVGLNAPTTVASSYTLSLPAVTPTAGQVLRANETTPTNLEWASVSENFPPSVTRTIYVTTYGNDTTGDGSAAAPYASLTKAAELANTLSSSTNPVVISIGSGVYTENNSAGPITFTAEGISVEGTSPTGVIIYPNTLSNTLISATTGVRFASLAFDANGVSSATGIALSGTGNTSSFSRVNVLNFATGVSCGGTSGDYQFDNCDFATNGTALGVNGATVLCNNCNIAGSATTMPANTGISATGAGSTVYFVGGTCFYCTTGMTLSTNAFFSGRATIFKTNTNALVATSASTLLLEACSFQPLATSGTLINIQASGAGTTAKIAACIFNAESVSPSVTSTAVQVTDQAVVSVTGGQINSYKNALLVGTSSDTSATQLVTEALLLTNCTNDIIQSGLATLNFNAGTATGSKITINDSTNVSISFFNTDRNNELMIGSLSNQTMSLLGPAISSTNNPRVDYMPSLYSAQAIGYTNSQTASGTLYALSNNNTDVAAVTTDRTKIAGLRLMSDTGSPVGGTSALRGWDVNKNGSTAELAFKYQNSDTTGQSAISQYTVLQLDGVNNQVQLPNTATQIVLGGDTNLYRSAASVLKTDGNLVVGGLTASRAVATNASSQLVSSATTATELGYVSGVTSSIQTQLDSKVAKAGDTMTGTLQLPAGTASAPSLVFTGSTTTGLSAPSGNTLVMSTGGVAQLSVSSSGTLTATSLAGAAGVVHNDVSGNLSSSLVVNADISPSAAIVDSKLATISTAGKVANSATTADSANTASAIVARDSSGNFTAGTITAATSFVGNLTGTVTGNVTGNLSGTVTANAGTAASPSITFAGDTNTGFSAASADTLVLSTGGVNRLQVGSTGTVTIAGLSSTGVVHNDSSGNLSTSLIVNDDIAMGTITDAKLATISTAGKVANSATTATSANTANAIVARDASGNFVVNQITVNGAVTAGTDVATKSYVDSVATGLQPKDAVVVVAASQVGSTNPPEGGQTIDSVAVVTGNRVLLAAQSNQVYNGIWVVDSTTSTSPWTRPSDFANGQNAQGAYMFVSEGATYANSSWVDTNNSVAIIGADNLTFSIFSNPGTISGANVGGQTGQIFRDKTGDIMNFKTLGSTDAHLTVTNNANTVTLATDATSANTASTLVARDASGNFAAGTITANLTGNVTGNLTGSVTGAASLNVLKAGDTMTGNLNLASQSAVRLQDATGGEYVGLNAPATVPTSYTLSLPSTSPTAGQFVRANASTPTNLEWVTVATSSTVTANETIYVSKDGNDTTGDGSQNAPYLTVAKAVMVANGAASATNPVVIRVGAGIFTESLMSITADGISVVGDSITGTTIQPTTPTANLFSITVTNVEITNLTLDAGGGTPASNGVGVTLSSNAAGTARFESVSVHRFSKAFALSSSAGVPIVLFNDLQSRGNAVTIDISSIRALIKNCIYLGPFSGSTVSNTGVQVTGSTSLVTILSNSFRLMDTCISSSGGANVRVLGTNIESSTNGIVASGSSSTSIVGCNFILNNASSINVAASGAGTVVNIGGTNFRCSELTPTGMALKTTTAASMVVDSSTIENAVTGIQCGASDNTDTSSTSMITNGLVILGCTNDILQYGTTSLVFNTGTAAAEKILLNDVTNVNTSFFDTNSAYSLSIGKLSNVDTTILEVHTTNTNPAPAINYKSSLYSTQGLVYQDPNVVPASIGVISNNQATVLGVTTDRTQVAGVRLVSDTGSPVGGTSALRGWDVNKNGTTAELAFKYQNSDTTGQSAISQYTVFQLDGVNNQVQLPNTATQIVLGSDTNLYRSAASVLKTDGNLAIGGLTASRAVATNASSQLVSSATTATELGYVSGVTSSIQTQLDSKVAKAGDTMTGTLQLPAGTASAPSLVFTGSTTTGLSVPTANTLTLSTGGTGRMSISSGGTVAIAGFAGAAGVVHNDVSGNLSSSLIVNADISSSAAIADSKLATISTAGKVANSATTATSANTASAIVLRDALGNFIAGTITASLTGAASLNVLKAGDTMTGTLTMTPSAGALAITGSNTASTAIAVTGGTSTGIGLALNMSAGTGKGLQITTAASTRAIEVNPISPTFTVDGTTGNTTIAGSTTLNALSTGVVHANASGVLSSSTIINTDVSASAAIDRSKLASGSANHVLINDGSGVMSSEATLAVSRGGTGASTLTSGQLLVGAGTSAVTFQPFSSANTASAVVQRDASGNFAAGTITASLTGAASLNVLKAGDTMTGTLTMTPSAGALAITGSNTASTAVQITGGTSTGVGLALNMSAGTGKGLQITTAASTRAIEVNPISPTFTVDGTTGNTTIAGSTTLSALSTGVVHANASGVLSSSTIVNADVSSSAAIDYSKLATMSTGQVLLGNTGTPTATTVSGAITIGATGITTLGSGVVSDSNVSNSAAIARSKLATGSANHVLINDGSGVMSSEATLAVSRGGTGASTLTSGQLLVGAGTSAVTFQPFSSANTASAVVQRDASGNFAAGTITASLTGAASLNVLKAGDTMTGTLTMTPSAGALAITGSNTVSAAVQITGGTSTGAGLALDMSAGTGKGLQITTAASTRAIEVNPASPTFTVDGTTGNTTIAGSTTLSALSTGVVHANASGVLSSSTIVNADVSSSAAIARSKLAAGSANQVLINDGSGVMSSEATLAVSRGGTGANTLTSGQLLVGAGTSAVTFQPFASANTASAVVQRDVSGNFAAGTITANLTGAASLNVLKAGDTMTGNLNLATQSALRLQDATGGEYVGLNAPATVPTSYTLSLPSTSPTAGQFVRANASTPTNLEWMTVATSSTVTANETIYVSKGGNDTTGDGSQNAPYLTVAKAVTAANGVASATNPVVIRVGAGIFTESLMSITADGISIVGDSITGTTIQPTTPTANLFSITVTNVEITNLTLDAGGGTPASNGVGVTLSSNAAGTARFESVSVHRFSKAFALSSSAGVPIVLFNDLQSRGNALAIDLSSVRAIIKNCIFLGPFTGSTASNAGVQVTGSTSLVTILSNVYRLMSAAITTSGGSYVRVLGTNFESSTNGITASGSSSTTAVGCNFILNNASSVNLAAADAGTVINISGSNFRCSELTPTGIAVKATTAASIIMDSSTIENAVTGIQCGASDNTDTSSTAIIASGVVHTGCTNDVLQYGTTTLTINSGTAAASKIILNDSTNVTTAFFDSESNYSLNVGKLSNVNTTVLEVHTTTANPAPAFNYKSSLYGAQALVYQDPNATPASGGVISPNQAMVVGVTTDRTQVAGLRLASDTGSPVGGTSALRGWDVNKNGTTAELAFKYQNSDTVGQSAISQYTVFQLDGVNNQVQLPNTATQIVLGSDTNLYRSAASVLKTDGNLVIGGLTASRAVATNASSQLVSSATTTTELGYVSGVTSSIQTQLDSKLAKAGDTMTGTLQLPAGTTSAPALVFTGSTTTGLSAPTANKLSLSTGGAERMSITSGGTVAIAGFAGAAGVVHNDVSGNLSSSLIVNADISSSAAIADSKLATISTAGKVANSATSATDANTASAIVARDSSGNFSAGTISATSFVGGLTGSVTGNVTGNLTGTVTASSGTAASPSITFAGDTNTGLSAAAADTLVLSTGGVNRLQVGSAGTVTIAGLSSTGVVHNDSSGNLSTSLIVNSDITNNTITDAKLTTISTAGKVANSATTATSANTASAIVARDALGNFSVNQITVTGSVVNNTDVATKGYVDSTATGLNPKDAVVVVATSQVGSTNPPQGGQTIDSVAVVTGNRVLLAAQSNQIYNGIWVVDSTTGTSPWTRPSDFANGQNARGAYMFVSGGATYANSSWVDTNSTTAIIGTDTLTFSIFSNPGTITGANVGGQTGQIFRDKTGDIMNFKTLGSTDSHLTVTNNANTVTLATDATSANTASTLVARDASGNFTAGTITANVTGNVTGNLTGSVTGAASLNVLKAGDTMTGNLNLATQFAVRLQDAAGGEYVGLNAPATVPTSYTLSLPTSPPAANQHLVAGSTTPTNLTWETPAEDYPPVTTRTIYVTTFGNDTTGDGSASTPYASLAKAASVANTISTSTSPVVISLGAGVYTENNSAGPIAFTAAGISVEGASTTGVFIYPSTLSNTLVSTTVGVRFASLTFNANGASTGTGVMLAGTGNTSVFSQVNVLNFATGISCAGTSGSYQLDTCNFTANGTALGVNAATVLCNNCSIQGSATTTPANTGISETGSESTVYFVGGTVFYCVTGITLSTNAFFSGRATIFRVNTNAIVLAGGSELLLEACSFQPQTTVGTLTNIQASGAGTTAKLASCIFNAASVSPSVNSTAIQVTNQAVVSVTGGQITNYRNALVIGTTGDTSTTQLTTEALLITGCTNDIIQGGSAMLNFNAGTMAGSKITINNSTNVSTSFFNLDRNNELMIGSLTDQNMSLLGPAISTSSNPRIDYMSSLYSARAIGYFNPQTVASTLYALSSSDTDVAAITSDRTKVAGLRLVSDTGSPVGGTTALRGWDMNKNASTAELAFKYQNSDTVGQSAITQYTVMQLDGVNNQVQLPNTATQIVLGSDTNLYRSAASVLKTDGNLVVGGLTASRAVATNASSQLVSSTTTDTELGYVSGVTSAIQTQLNSKLPLAGGTMTGTLQLPAGTASAPALVFTGSTTTGLSAPSGNTLVLSTGGTVRLSISSSGTLTASSLAGTAGVVHNDLSGNLSSSLIVNADVSPTAAITDSKLATISTAGKVANSATTATDANTASAIVARDSSGNFSAGTITANLTGSVTGAASLNVLKSGDTMTGTLTMTPSAGAIAITASNTASTAVAVTGGTSTGKLLTLTSGVGSGTGLTIDTSVGTGKGLQITTAASTRAIEVNPASPTFTVDGTTGNTTIAGSTTLSTLSTGVVHANASGVLSSSTIVNADVSSSAAIDYSKLATMSTGQVLLGNAGTPTATTVSGAITIGATGVTTLSSGVVSDSNVSGSAAIARSKLASGSANHVLINDGSGVMSSEATLAVSRGGTGASTLTSGQLLVGAGTSAVTFQPFASANTASAVVQRDASGNFAAGTITASLTGAASLNVLKAGDTMIGLLTMTPSAGAIAITASNTASTALQVTGGTSTGKLLTLTGGVGSGTGLTIDTSAGTGKGLQITTAASTNAIEVNPISPTFTVDGTTGNTTIAGSTTLSALSTGVVHANASGVLSSSTIVNADVSASAAIDRSKLAPGSANQVLINDGSGVMSSEATLAVSRGGTGASTLTSGQLLVGAGTSAVTFQPFASANTASAVVQRDASGNFAAGTITASLTGAASLNVLKAGDTMTGTLTMTPSAGALAITGSNTASTAVQITGGTSTGAGLALDMSAGTGKGLQITTAASTRAIEVNPISPTFTVDGTTGNTTIAGSITLSALSTGVVHANASGALSSSTIVNADVSSSAAIARSKLASGSANQVLINDGSGVMSSEATLAVSRGGTGASTLTSGQLLVGAGTSAVTFQSFASTNTASAVVQRDASGNFAAGTITASLTGAASLNVLKAGDTMTGTLTMMPSAGALAITGSNTASTVVQITGGTSTGAGLALDMSAGTGKGLQITTAASTRAIEVNPISPTFTVDGTTGNTTIAGSTTLSALGTGVVHANASGVLSSSTIVNTDVSVSAAIDYSKLATMSTGQVLLGNAGTPTATTVSGAITIGATGVTTLGSGVVSDGNVSNSAAIARSKLAAGSANQVLINDGSGVMSSEATLAVSRGGTGASTLTSGQLLVGAGTSAVTFQPFSSANTASAVVQRDASGNFAAGTITASLTGAASLNVLKAGDTMTGLLTMTPSAGAIAITASNTASTALQVTGGTSTGKLLVLTGSTGSGTGLTIDTSSGTGKGMQITTAAGTNALEVNPIAPKFTVDGTTGNTTIAGSTTLSALSTGVVHANASGVLSSSTIVNADVSASAAIDRSKLASGSANHVLINDGSGVMSSEATLAVSRGGTGASTLTSGQLLVGAGTSAVTFQPFSSANTASAVVQRDASGNFAAGTITASLTGAASLNVLKAGDTMTGTLTMTPSAGALAITGSNTASTAVQITGGTSTGAGLAINMSAGTGQGVQITTGSGVNALVVNPASPTFTVNGTTGRTSIASNTVQFNTGGTNALNAIGSVSALAGQRMIFGSVNTATSVISGSGFTYTDGGSAGVGTINFTNVYSAVPFVVMTVLPNTAAQNTFAKLTAVAAGSFDFAVIRDNGAAADGVVNFMVIGSVA